MTNTTINASKYFVFEVDSVDFDFDDGPNEVTQEDKDCAIQSVVGKAFAVETEDNVCDFISDFTGWCIEDITYHKVA